MADEAVDVRVEHAPDGTGWLGHVAIAGPGALERVVRGERCEDVVAALALITVLRLEGSSQSSERRAGASAAAGPAGAGAAAATSATTAGAPSAMSGNATNAPSTSGAATGAEPSSPSTPSSPATPATPSAPESPAASPASDEARTDPIEPSPARSTPVAPPAPAIADEARPTTPAATASEPDDAEPSSSDDERTASASRASEPEPPEAIGRSETSDEAPDTDDTSAAASEPEAESRWQWPATRAALVAIGGYSTVPSHAFRGALGAELQIGEGRSSWLSSLSFAYARGNDTVDPGDLGLTLLTLELALCPPSIIAESSVWVSACASARAGRVRLAFTSTRPDLDARETWRPWVAVGPSLRVGVPLSEHWTLRGVGELAVQLVRDTFGVRLGADADAQILPLYRPEALSIEVGAGIGYSF